MYHSTNKQWEQGSTDKGNRKRENSHSHISAWCPVWTWSQGTAITHPECGDLTAAVTPLVNFVRRSQWDGTNNPRPSKRWLQKRLKFTCGPTHVSQAPPHLGNYLSWVCYDTCIPLFHSNRLPQQCNAIAMLQCYTPLQGGLEEANSIFILIHDKDIPVCNYSVQPLCGIWQHFLSSSIRSLLLSALLASMLYTKAFIFSAL